MCVQDIGKKCTGCKMCKDICPQNAIYFEINSEGFWYPKVNQNLCNSCGVCIKKCPAVASKQLEVMQDPEVYAAWSKNRDVRHESTSGGVFWEFAISFIRRGGLVVGSQYGDDWKSAKHCIVRTEEELELLRGSKYFQSDTEGIYKAVKDEADLGKEILFCGTPCQIAALSMYLGKEYEKVYFMDFICRCINSPLAFNKYISELEELYGADAVRVQLKNKDRGWQSLASKVEFSNGKSSCLDYTEDWWIKGFVPGGFYGRESCYCCNYRTLPRKVADISIGDFWGIDDVSEYDMFEGVSVILLNSPKGRTLFNRITSQVRYKKKSIEDVFRGNPALLENLNYSDGRNIFFKEIQNRKFSDAVKKAAGVSEQKRKNILISIKNMQREIREVQKKKNVSIIKYIYYNYFSDNIIRTGKAKLIPDKDVVFDFHKTSKLYIHGDRDFRVGINKLRGSKAETFIRMERDAVWKAKHGADIFYSTTVEIKENATLETGYFSMNTGSVIVVDLEMELGEDVMIGRNVLMYDSDFHQVFDQSGNEANFPQKVCIEDHVWLTGNITVLKGARIGQGAIISAYTQINKDVPQDTLISGKSVGKPIKETYGWRRQRFKYAGKNWKYILYGYGYYGKQFYKKHKEDILYIIDNGLKESNIYSFKEFNEKHPTIDENLVWVITAQNYFEELYQQVRSKYPNHTIISI